MKLLKEKYEGLRKLKNLPKYLKDFLSIPEVKMALEKYEFNTLYNFAHDYLGTTHHAYKVTELLNSLSINPLDYLDYIPRGFLFSTTIKSITIPNHITSIGNYAFCNCNDLTSIVIPDSVTIIGEYAFYNCKGLTSVRLPNNIISIKDNTFGGCKKLTHITIPNNVKNIGDYAFNHCDSLLSIYIPDSVTHINGGAFFGCESLTSIIIPSSVTSIGHGAFYMCTNLKNITYKGTKSDWEKINKSNNWDKGSFIKTIHCTDGDINL